MSYQLSNVETENMFKRIKDTCPEQLISDIQEAATGYIGMNGITAEIKSVYSTRFADEFSKAQLAKIDWQQVVAALATL